MTQKFDNLERNLKILVEECESISLLASSILARGLPDWGTEERENFEELLNLRVGDLNAILGILQESKVLRPLTLAIQELKKRSTYYDNIPTD